MLNIEIIAIDKIRNKNFNLAIEEYLKRLKPYATIKITELKPEAFDSNNHEKIKKIEGEKILKILEKYPKENIWLLHERGDEIDSIKFSKQVENNGERIFFVIGGALGFSPEILKKYQQISLSRMTMPHELARLVLIEQLYRATTILKGKNYHY